jgi:peptidoglycan glycosyltransferase
MQPHLRHLIAWPAGLLGLIFLGTGLFVEDANAWRLILLTGLWLLSLVPRAFFSTTSPVVHRGLIQLMLVLVLGFGAVGLQLARYQISQAEMTRERALEILQPPQPVAEEVVEPVAVRPADRTSLGHERIWPIDVEYDRRGNIFDRDGFVLATDQAGSRFYPYPDLGQIIGFQSRLYGVSGVEATYDDYLSGEHSLNAAELLEARLLDTSPVDTMPADVYLTLDTDLQRAAQAALGTRAGGVALIDPNTGAILALASFPRYDPNLIVLPDSASEEDVARVRANWDALAARADSPLINRAAQGRYPPGSTFKTLTAAAAIDSGVMPSPASRVTCPNRLWTGEVGAPPVRNAVEGLGGITGNPASLRRMYAFSCNTAFAQIGLLLGPDIYTEYAMRFGLGFAQDENHTADLRDIAVEGGTVAGDPAFLQRPAGLADTAFGQGQILVSPLDMARMAGVIANDGRLMRPYLVSRVQRGEEVLYTAQPEVIRQAISPQSAAMMRSIMQTSVEIGYASPAAIPGVSVGGKTGTAEVPYGAPHSWFMAVAPLDQPRFAIAVVVENGGEGSLSALPVARQVLRVALGR